MGCDANRRENIDAIANENVPLWNTHFAGLNPDVFIWTRGFGLQPTTAQDSIVSLTLSSELPIGEMIRFFTFELPNFARETGRTCHLHLLPLRTR